MPGVERGHPGPYRIVTSVIPSGIFIEVSPGVSVHQDSGYAQRVAVQVANTCQQLRRPGAPACVLPFSHAGLHADGEGRVWGAPRSAAGLPVGSIVAHSSSAFVKIDNDHWEESGVEGGYNDASMDDIVERSGAMVVRVGR